MGASLLAVAKSIYYVYKLSTNNLCTNLWSNPFSYLFKGQTKERKECINV